MSQPDRGGAPGGDKLAGMNETPFPKPPPAEHLPLEAWLRRTDRAEAGREPFFRGRDEEYDVFRGAVNSLNDGMVGGGTMVFQGAPGAGKSALMAECMEAVRRHSKPEDPWLAVSIRPGILDSPLDAIEPLVEAAKMESARLRNMAAGANVRKKLDELLERAGVLGRQLMERGGGVFGVSVGGRKEATVTVGGAFSSAAPLLEGFRIVVFVDEAQNVPVTDTSRVVLDILHRDTGGIPLVTAFFGLSNTEKILGECGLSRLADGRVVNLHPLAHGDAASAVRGAFDAYGFAGTPEDREQWVDSIAKLSQGWPQHVNRVSVAAARVIQEHGGGIAMGHLEKALARGRESKNAYYAKRLAAARCDSWVYRKLALAAKERDGGLSRHEIGELSRFAREEKGQSVDDFVTDALRAGLLAPARDLFDIYSIPIPSLADYLRALNVRTPAALQTEGEQ